jgi:hypothetical protein
MCNSPIVYDLGAQPSYRKSHLNLRDVSRSIYRVNAGITVKDIRDSSNQYEVKQILWNRIHPSVPGGEGVCGNWKEIVA